MGIWSWNSAGIEGKVAREAAERSGLGRLFGFIAKTQGRLMRQVGTLSKAVATLARTRLTSGSKLGNKAGSLLVPTKVGGTTGDKASDRLRSRAKAANNFRKRFITLSESGFTIGTGGLLLPYAVGAAANQVMDKVDEKEQILRDAKKNGITLSDADVNKEVGKRIGLSAGKFLLTPVETMGTAYARIFTGLDKDNAQEAVNMIWDDYFKTDLQRKSEHKERERLRKSAQKEVTKIIEDDRQDIESYMPTTFKLGTPSDKVQFRREMRKLNKENLDQKENALRFIANRNVDNVKFTD